MELVERIGQVEDHGGSLGRARRLFPQAPEPFVDLSTGINPHSYPLFDLPATAFTRLPEPERVAQLNQIAATAYGASSGAHVAAAPGTQILLPHVMALVPPGRAMVLGPTYAEHARAATLAGHQVEEVQDVSLLEGADIAIVVNPNNPDGRIVERGTLLALAEKLSRKGGTLIVDEAFMDVAPAAASVSPDVGRRGLVVLRSFGKFFGLAGVRLGFVLSSQEIAAKISSEFGPWAVNGPALEIGIRALADTGWQEAMRRRLAGEATRLDVLLSRSGVPVSGGTNLFRFVELSDAQSLFAALGEAGVLTRNFGWSRTALRIGLPADDDAWQRLEAGLAVWKNGHRSEIQEVAS